MEGHGNRLVQEGCLSLPGIEIWKRRPIRIYAKYQDEYGLNIHKHADGFLAQVMCHEIDHLDGRLMTDEDDRIWHEIHGGV
jgi:peptide deformylase